MRKGRFYLILVFVKILEIGMLFIKNVSCGVVFFYSIIFF